MGSVHQTMLSSAPDRSLPLLRFSILIVRLRPFAFTLILGAWLLTPVRAQDDREDTTGRERMRVLPPTPRSSPAARPTPAPFNPWAPRQPKPPPGAVATPEPFQQPTPRPSLPPPRPTASSTPDQGRTNEPPSVIIIKPGQEDDAGEPEPPPLPPPPKKRGFWARLFGIGGDDAEDPGRYRFLTRTVLEGINRAPVRGGRWKYTVVHNSGTRQGSARAFDFYHRHTKHMPNGMAYHFVIGNGTTTRDGQIEIGERWRRQINGGHVHSDYLNNIALGICLVGDFNRDQPTRAQYASLQELITYLRKRVGRVDRRLSIVKAHREINPVPTDCPGNLFSYSWLHRQFDQ